MVPSLQTLFLPLENGDVLSSGRVLFLGAAAHPYLKNLDADLWQPFKPLASGIAATKILPEGTYGLALVHVPKQVDEAKFWLALALERLELGGTLLAAASNDAGGSRIEGWLKEAGFETLSYSKNKARAVWGKKTKTAIIPEKWKQGGDVQRKDVGEGLTFLTQPGLFSWDRIDPASRLLAANFPPALGGKVADFGCGIGYLSYKALENYPKVSSLTLVEADARALACAQKNLAEISGAREVISLWHDAGKALPESPTFDHILMNPPFHVAKKTNIALGLSFITTAATHLKKGGALSLVANVHLPYEAALETLFRNVKPVVTKEGFKVLRAVK
jgi:16S rRNA (guanine1207-N2)-methyltransferase